MLILEGVVYQFHQVLWAPLLGDGGLDGACTPNLAIRTYKGVSVAGDSVEVWLEESLGASTPPAKQQLSLYLELKSHSPNGFGWGYGGSGPAQLALALLVDALGDANQALTYYQEFKREYVSKWGDEWSITAEEIRRFVANIHQASPPVKFSLGQIVATPAAIAAVPHVEIVNAIRHHLIGEWGELDRHDWNANNQALVDGSRLLSAYNTSSGERFWIITEADRSYTTILLPEDY